MCKDNTKYTIKQFEEDFPDDDACLDKIFQLNYSDLSHCPKCKETVTYKRVATRKCYHCPKCYNQIYPTKGTVFEKSTTSLKNWFYTMHLFTASKNGISAMELKRHIGVTYKTAWRMLKQIRTTIKVEDTPMDGIVSGDETFVGGKNKNRHWDKKVKGNQGRAHIDKTPVLGLMTNGKVRAFVVSDTGASSIQPIIKKHVKMGSFLVTDEWIGYSGLGHLYNHQVVDHGRKQYKNDAGFSSNCVENFWSIVKRTINGSYIQVSRKYLQLYVNECVFRFNNRSNPQIFNALLSSLV